MRTLGKGKKILAIFQLTQARSLAQVEAARSKTIIRIHPREPVLDSGATYSY